MINSFSKVAGHKNQSPFSNTSDKDPKKEIRETFPITTASPQRQSETKLRVKPIQEAKDLCSKNVKRGRHKKMERPPSHVHRLVESIL